MRAARQQSHGLNTCLVSYEHSTRVGASLYVFKGPLKTFIRPNMGSPIGAPVPMDLGSVVDL